MTSASSYLRPKLVVIALVACLAVSILVPNGRDDTEPVSVDSMSIAADVNGQWRDMVNHHLPAELVALPPQRAIARIAQTPSTAVTASMRQPRHDSPYAAESALARLLAQPRGHATIREVFDAVDDDAVTWIAATFPAAIGNLSGVAYSDRIAANRIRLAAEVDGSRDIPSPDRPWTDAQREPRHDLATMLANKTKLIFFDPDGNDGQGSWVELRGSLATASRIAVLVPGGSAFLVSENFTRYSTRAGAFVSEGQGDLAVLVWAGAPFPSGWVQEASPSWAQRAAPVLIDFVADLNSRIRNDAVVTLAGHSYGGAIVGLAEKYGVDVDQVLHIASAGAGYGVDSVEDYRKPCRPRYVMMAPRDPISYVQDIPQFTGLGHGASPSRLAGVKQLTTGSLPDNPLARDDVYRTLGSQGITGKRIEGFHAHSEVFIEDSDAWRNLFAVFMGHDRRLRDSQSAAASQCA